MYKEDVKRQRQFIVANYEHPDWCLELHSRHQTDLYLYTTMSEHPIYGPQYGTVRMCSTCGKKYNDAPALA